MTGEIYQRLAQHLDQLPAGFPPTPDGLELRILRRLFTPEEAALAVHLTLIPESAAVIAHRAGLPPGTAAIMLEQMAAKGLIMDSPAALDADGKPVSMRYAAAQFVVGIWEFQVNRLNEDLVRDVDAYLPYLFNPQSWKAAPQLRTIPVNESLQAPSSVMTYESAEQVVRSHERFAVQPCICRQEKNLLGEGCGKPLEVCLSMDGAADTLLRHQRGRAISKEEALGVLRLADEAGLVVQPGNTRDPNYLCCCCGDCCGILRTAKLHPRPAEFLASPFFAVSDAEKCAGCGLCLERCQMDAIDLDEGVARVSLERCIGCGLCVTTCPEGALSLERKGEDQAPYVPHNNIDLYLRLAQARRVLPPLKLARWLFRSAYDRIRTMW